MLSRQRGAMFAVMLALGALVGHGGSAMVRAQGPRTTSRVPQFEAVLEKNVMIPMRDGVALAADIYRPGRDGKPSPGRFPALLTRTPYDKDGAGGEGRYYAERGYVVVANDVRGRYASEGKWRMIVDDPDDGFDVVEWIAQKDWSDGKIGTFGTSYPGGTQHALAEMNPPHLTTMVPIDSSRPVHRTQRQRLRIHSSSRRSRKAADESATMPTACRCGLAPHPCVSRPNTSRG
jgi:uncharacterized protein